MDKVASPSTSNTFDPHDSQTNIKRKRNKPSQTPHPKPSPTNNANSSNVNLIMPVDKNTVSVEVYGQSIRALVDTGATVSCVAAFLLPKLGIEETQLQPTSDPDVRAVGGEVHSSLGDVSLPLSFGNLILTHKFRVFEKFHQPIILGMDFLVKNSAIFNTVDKTLFLKDDNQQVYYVDTNTGMARVTNDVTIAPNSVANIEVSVSLPEDDNVLLEPLPILPKLQLAGAKCIVSTKGKAFLQVLNPSQDSVSIPSQKVVASASIIHPQSVFTLDDSKASKKNRDKNTEGEPIEFDLQGDDLSENEKQIMQRFLQQYRKAFANDLQELGKTEVQSHHIETGNAAPVRQRFYRQTPATNTEMNRQIDEMLKADIIEESHSMWQSPVVMVKKKSGQLRFAVDYRKLNAVTQQYTFPLPRLEDVFDTIGESKAQIFSTLDLASGFWQIPMDPSTAHKSAFVTPTGVYQWKRMPFGLVNAPASFQALMTQVLRGLNWKTCLVYVDDILVFSKTFDEHLRHLAEIFDRLISAGLTLKPNKCRFALKEVQYLGHVITKDGVCVDVAKTDAMRSFPVPTTQKEVRSFLGLCNYYRKFVKDYSKIASPLNALLSKDDKFSWTMECQRAFDKLKSALTSPPVLAYPDHNKGFILTADASGTAIGYILGQLDDNNQERVIAYGGRSLNIHERKYNITERECLAIIEGIKSFHVYLAGQRFKVFTDHVALKWLMSIKQATGRLARWAVLLQGYDFEVCHKAGIRNEVADALSRRTYPECTDHTSDPVDEIPSPDIATVSSLQFMEAPQQVHEFPMHEHISALSKNETPESVSELQSECPDFSTLYAYFARDELPEDKKLRDRILSESNQYIFLDGVLYHYYQPRSHKKHHHPEPYLRQLAVPRALREDVLRSYHDSAAGGAHLGFDRTYRAIQIKYYWPKMYQNIADYVRSCAVCQSVKKQTQQRPAPLVNMPIAETFSRIHMDILGPLTTSKEGYKYILLIVDSFSKWPEAFPLKTMEAKEIAKVLYAEIFSRYGAPDVIVSDRGQNFISKLVTAVCEIFQVTRHRTSSYHPQTNSTCERMNSTIAQCLRAYVDKEQQNWPDVLPSVMMAMRMSPSTQSSLMSPFHLVFGREMNLPFDTSLIPKDGLSTEAKVHVDNLMRHLKTTREIATQNVKTAQDRQKQQHDKKAEVPTFRLGEYVMLHSTRVPKGLSPKLHPPWDGPFYITNVGPNNTYKLRRCSTHKELTSPVHANRLKIYHNPEHRRQLDPPLNNPPDDNHIPSQENNNDNNNNDNEQLVAPNQHEVNQPQTQPKVSQPTTETEVNQPPNTQDAQPSQQGTQDDNRQWYVEKLLRYKREHGKRIFLVKWFDSNVKSWEPEENISETLIREYHVNKTQTGRKRKTKRGRPTCFE